RASWRSSRARSAAPPGVLPEKRAAIRLTSREPPPRVVSMSDAEDFATLFAREAARPVLEVGQIVKGSVIQITAESVFVDVGSKGEAWIERAELTDADGKLKVGVGDQVEATVVSTGDEVRLSHKLRQGAQARQALAGAAQTGIPVEGKVAAGIKGGYEVAVGGRPGLC